MPLPAESRRMIRAWPPILTLGGMLLLTIFVRAILLYSFSILAVRLMGKRQIGQLQPYELVAAILIADLVAEPMSGAETPLLYGIVPVSALVLMHSVFGLLGMKSPAFRRLLNGSARVLIREGNIQYGELKQVCMPVSDLMEIIRAAGILNIADVETAVLETNGVLSVFPRGGERPVTLESMRLAAQEADLPHVLISDGKYRESEMGRAGVSREALDAFLGPGGPVLLCVLDSRGTLFWQRSGGSRSPLSKTASRQAIISGRTFRYSAPLPVILMSQVRISSEKRSMISSSCSR